MQISDHISLAEATRTSTGIPNNPNPTQFCAMRVVAKLVFEPLRAHMGEPIRVTSFFRSEAVNRRVGGSATSQHVKGEAMDITLPGRNKEIFEFIRHNLAFDQLIWEFGNDAEPAWVHVSYSLDRNRKQSLLAVRANGRTKYINYAESVY